MRRVSRLTTLLTMSVVGTMMFSTEPAAANTKVTTIYHTDFTFAISDWCDFKVRFHVVGPFKAADYFDSSGFLYKTISTAGPGGPYTWTATANGTTLNMQMQSFMQVVTYNADGSADTQTIHGVDLRFTAQGSGIVLQDVGTVVRDGDGNVTVVAGPHQSLSDDFRTFCAALS